MSDELTASVSWSGDLDFHRREEVTASLPSPKEFNRVVINCAAVTSLDSSIVTALLRYSRSFAEAGRDPLNIVIVATPSVRRVLDIAGLGRKITAITAPITGANLPEPV